MGPLGAFLGPLGGVLGGLGAVLGLSCGGLGASWGVPGASWRNLGGSWGCNPTRGRVTSGGRMSPENVSGNAIFGSRYASQNHLDPYLACFLRRSPPGDISLGNPAWRSPPRLRLSPNQSWPPVLPTSKGRSWRSRRCAAPIRRKQRARCCSHASCVRM